MLVAEPFPPRPRQASLANRGDLPHELPLLRLPAKWSSRALATLGFAFGISAGVAWRLRLNHQRTVQSWPFAILAVLMIIHSAASIGRTLKEGRRETFG